MKEVWNFLVEVGGYSELVLNGTIECDVSNSASDSLCEQFYGGYARFCRQGECRCQQNTSYDENNRCSMFENTRINPIENHFVFQ